MTLTRVILLVMAVFVVLMAFRAFRGIPRGWPAILLWARCKITSSVGRVLRTRLEAGLKNKTRPTSA